MRRRRRRSSPDTALRSHTHSRNLIPFRVHALSIRIVVAALCSVTRYLTRVGTCSSSHQKSTSSADGSSGPHMTRCSTNCGAEACTYCRASNRSCGCAPVGLLLRGLPNLLRRPLSANCVIGLEFLKGFSGSWYY